MISFIIPAYNEEALLPWAIEAIRAAAESLGEPYEVVVADDASSDSTADVARQKGCQVVSVQHRQIAATRNAGAQAASGELLIFVDADTIVTAAAVRAAVEAIRAGAVGGGCAFRFDGRVPFYGQLMQAVALPVYRLAGLASGCFLFSTREAFLAVGGFDESLFAAEEGVMSRALRKQGKFIVLREHVITSGRKLRGYSARTILGVLLRLAVGGSKSLQRRDGLEIWYGEPMRDGVSGIAPLRRNGHGAQNK